MPHPVIMETLSRDLLRKIFDEMSLFDLNVVASVNATFRALVETFWVDIASRRVELPKSSFTDVQLMASAVRWDKVYRGVCEIKHLRSTAEFDFRLF